LALSLARIVGDEHVFISLLRQTRTDPDTAAAQAVDALRRRLERAKRLNEATADSLRAAGDAFAHGAAEAGLARLAEGLGGMPPGILAEPGAAILAECMRQLQASGLAHPEYLLLALHVLAVAVTV
jgi:hypothetical protein